MNSNYISKQIALFHFKKKNKVHLIIHRNDGMNDYLLEITISWVNKRIISKPPDFIVILNASCSMKNYVHNLVKNIIPRGLNLLNYQDTDTFHIITLKSKAKLQEMKLAN